MLSDLGLSPTGIAKKIGFSHHTTIKYLNQQEIFSDPKVKELIEKIRTNEIDDLYLLGVKSRSRLHELLDEGNTKVIETTAVMDRSFQQRRLLEELSTQNIAYADVLRARSEAAAELEKIYSKYPELIEQIDPQVLDLKEPDPLS